MQIVIYTAEENSCLTDAHSQHTCALYAYAVNAHDMQAAYAHTAHA
jgi:hypothetical protein